MADLSVGVVLDLAPAHPYHLATLAAIDHAAAALGVGIDLQVFASETPCDVDRLAAIVIGPGSPYHDPESVLALVRAARERGVPLVGT